jgi:DNA-directed RNA polymerase subunit RPC12/RpoP
MKTSATCPVCSLTLTCSNVPQDYFNYIRCPRCLTKLMVKMRFMWVYWAACIASILGLGWLLLSVLGLSRDLVGVMAFWIGVALQAPLIIALIVGLLFGPGRFIADLNVPFALAGAATIGLGLMIFFRHHRVWARFFVKETWGWIDVPCSSDEKAFVSFVRSAMRAIQTARRGAGPQPITLPSASSQQHRSDR